MGIEYDDRPVLAKQKDEVAEKTKGKKTMPVKEKKPTKANVQRRVVQKHKAPEPGDVQMGREMATPSKKSQKFTLTGGVCEGLGIMSLPS